MIKNTFLIVIACSLGACTAFSGLDKVIPDNRTTYQKSEKLPDLEVPPDLTTEALNDPLVVPGEENANTLSEFQRQKFIREGQPSAEEMPSLYSLGEKWLVVQGSNPEIWPRLKKFWETQGYEMDLHDAELGVLETVFKDISVEGVVTYREKFKILSEPGKQTDEIILFLSSDRQEKNHDEEGNITWIDQASDDKKEKQLLGELTAYFYGTSIAQESMAPAKADQAETAEKQAPESKENESGEKLQQAPESGAKLQSEILDTGEDKHYLLIPIEFSKAWKSVGTALHSAGVPIEQQNQEEGVYTIYYQAEKKGGLASKLAFWKGAPKEKEFRISLTGIGNKTEVVVLDDQDNWSENQDAHQILDLLKNQVDEQLGSQDQSSSLPPEDEES